MPFRSGVVLRSRCHPPVRVYTEIRVQTVGFTPDPIYFESSYYLGPERAGSRLTCRGSEISKQNLNLLVPVLVLLSSANRGQSLQQFKWFKSFKAFKS
jgi:hypothetical protein